jgi:hypothetical protein
MRTWIKVNDDGLVINILRQEEKPVDCELGVWIPQMHPFVGPEWRIGDDGSLIRPAFFKIYLLRPEAFIARFSSSEWNSITEGANSNSELAAILNTINQLEIVNLQSSQLSLIISGLVSNGIINAERANQLLLPAAESEEPILSVPTIPTQEDAP